MMSRLNFVLLICNLIVAGIFWLNVKGILFTRSIVIDFVAIGLPFQLMVLNEALRDIRVYCEWLFVGMMYFAIFFIYRNDEILLSLKSQLHFRRSFLLCVLYFGVCRFLSKKFYGTEIVIPSNKLATGGSSFHQDEGRNENLLDFVYVIGFFLIVIISGLQK